MCNKVVALLYDSKHRFFEKLNSLTTKQFWKTMRILNRKTSSSVVIESNTGKANALNTFFHSCFNYSFPEFPITAEPNLPPESYPKHLVFSTEESVYDLLIALDTRKSTGCDGVSANMLKQTACTTALPLSNLLNLSLSTGKVPLEWKLPE